jgi:hypothetical protein
MADSNTLSAQRAKGYLRELGWTNNQAAGLVGNFQQESGVNLDPSITSPDGTSYGIAQWTAPRQNIFKQTYGKPIQGTSLKEQLNFVNYELNNNEKAAGNALRATTTASEAALVVSNQYERPSASAANNAQRIAYANNAAVIPPILASNDTLSQEELDKLNNTPTPGETEIQRAIQETADSELGVGKVEVGQVRITVIDEPNAANATSTNPDTITTAQPLPNRLKEYPSYIYGLSLHLLTDEQYNKVVETQTYNPANVLIASAGRYSSSFPRNEFFSEDFYFDDLNITTIIAPNDTSRNTNAIDTSFTIIEPYGFTLMERLLRVADAMKSGNYLDMPYLLQIDFFAMDDGGNIVGSVEELRKRIPVKLIKLDVKVSARGAEYKMAAMPFNHSAYEATAISTPANFEIVASTVKEFFQSIEGSEAELFSLALDDIRERYNRPVAQPTKSSDTNAGNGAANLLRQAVGNPTKPATKSPGPVPASKPKYNSVKSYGTAINAWYRALKEAGKIAVNDVYRFEFAPDPKTGVDLIGPSPFTRILTSTPKETAMKSNQTTNDINIMAKADLGQGDASHGTYDKSKAIFQVQYGTTIEKLLEYIIRNSNYFQDQLVIPDGLSAEEYQQKKESLKNVPLKWFKIIPTVRLLDFDSTRKIWSREITYTVQSYTIYNIRSDLGPQGVQLYPVKNYNYIYTGKNDDVFDFDIVFNAMYYNQVTAYRDNLSELNPSAASATNDYQSQNAPNYSGGTPPKGLEYNAIMPLVVKPVVQNSRAQATGKSSNALEVASVDLTDSLMTNSQGDMIGLRLKILGDPDFIKQDDVFYRPALSGTNLTVKPSSDPRLLPNNSSLRMDDGGVYVQVLFRVPTDIDESTGLMKFDSKYQHSVFSGLYQVIQVSNSFSKGQFVQDLELVRMPRQSAFDYTTLGQNSNSNNREDSSKEGPLGVKVPSNNSTLSIPGSGTPASDAQSADTDIDQRPGGEQPVALIENADDLVETPEYMELKNVIDNAPEDTINAQNEPAPFAPNFTPVSVRGNQVPGQAAIQ